MKSGRGWDLSGISRMPRPRFPVSTRLLLLGSVFRKLADVSNQLPAFLVRQSIFPGRHRPAAIRHFPEQRPIRLRGHQLGVGEVRGLDLDGLGAGTVPYPLFAVAKHAIIRKELLRFSQSFRSGREWILHL